MYNYHNDSIDILFYPKFALEWLLIFGLGRNQMLAEIWPSLPEYWKELSLIKIT